MNSVDTNILFYAVNRDCAEHGAARELVDRALATPRDWIVPDQVYFELYRLVRSRSVLQKPLSAIEAANLVAWYRNSSGWGRCGWDTRLFDRALPYLRDAGRGASSVFDVTIALVLKDAGVTRLYTRNVADFTAFEWLEVVNPID